MSDPGPAGQPGGDPGGSEDSRGGDGTGPGPVHVHVHLAVAGTFPLRVADVLFADQAVLAVEYELLTPLFGVARGGVPRAGERAREVYRREGPAGLLAAADRVHRLPYPGLDGVRVYDGSAIGRPKIALDASEGAPYAYRVHAPVDVPALTVALEDLGARRGFQVSSLSRVGFRPLASLRRFLADR